MGSIMECEARDLRPGPPGPLFATPVVWGFQYSV